MLMNILFVPNHFKISCNQHANQIFPPRENWLVNDLQPEKRKKKKTQKKLSISWCARITLLSVALTLAMYYIWIYDVSERERESLSLFAKLLFL